MRESRVKMTSLIYLMYVIIREVDLQALDRIFQMLQSACSNKRKHIGSLLHHISKGDIMKGSLLGLPHRFKLCRHCLVGIARHAFSPRIVRLALFQCFCRLKFPSTYCAIWYEGHTFIPAQRDDVALKVTDGRIPKALVGDKLAQAVITCVLIRFGDNPGGAITSQVLAIAPRYDLEYLMLSSPIRDSKIVHFARTDEIIQTIHELRNRCVVIPPVNIKEVNVGRPQILQGVLKSQTKTLCAVATKV